MLQLLSTIQRFDTKRQTKIFHYIFKSKSCERQKSKMAFFELRAYYGVFYSCHWCLMCVYASRVYVRVRLLCICVFVCVLCDTWVNFSMIFYLSHVICTVSAFVYVFYLSIHLLAIYLSICLSIYQCNNLFSSEATL